MNQNFFMVGSVRQGEDYQLIELISNKSVENSKKESIIIQDFANKYFDNYSAFFKREGYKVFCYNPFRDRWNRTRLLQKIFNVKQPVAIFINVPNILDPVSNRDGLFFLERLISKKILDNTTYSIFHTSKFNVVLTCIEELQYFSNLKLFMEYGQFQNILFYCFGSSIPAYNFLLQDD